MTTLRQSLITAQLLIGVGFVIVAYQVKMEHSWRWIDLGWTLISICYLMVVYRKIILAIGGWVLFVLCLNSLITSWFFDIGEYGFNQKVFVWAVASIVGLLGVCKNGIDVYWMIQKEKENKKCRKDAKQKYAAVLRRVQAMESTLESKNETLEIFINKLLGV